MAIVEGADVAVCPGPVPLDGCDDGVNDEHGDPPSKGSPPMGVFVSSTTDAPYGSDGGDPQEVPQAEEVGVIDGLARPEVRVVHEENGKGARGGPPILCLG
jgi:hypothetical protein